MTKGEFQQALKGHYEYKQKDNIENAWLIGLMVGRAFDVSKDNPYPSLDEITAQLTTPPETDEELFEIAKQKGIEVPEGM
jgi:hypothetical protein